MLLFLSIVLAITTFFILIVGGQLTRTDDANDNPAVPFTIIAGMALMIAICIGMYHAGKYDQEKLSKQITEAERGETKNEY